ncbi:MAG: pilus assembly protein TadG-related protein [Candidatus Wallbacteria bacterium]|nr:pilus assembly protein TadG-related protein [Candidatus Wallbacteria bacterium]
MKIKSPDFLSNRKGISTVVIALLSPFLLGMVALAVDVGYAYMQKSTLDQAAQLAALSAAQTMKTSDDPAVIRQKVLDVYAQNGLPASDNLVITVTKGAETVFIDTNLKMTYNFAKVLGFNDVLLRTQSLAELCADGSARLIKMSTYDLMPFGIPHGRAAFSWDGNTLYIDGSLAESWNENSSFRFNVGSEYLLKLGEGASPDPLGRKYLIPMDGGEDVTPKDAQDPVCPEIGSHTQAQPLKAYGLVHWCLQHRYTVDWLLDYNGGSYLVNYHPDIDTAVSTNGVYFSDVSKILLTAEQAQQLMDYLGANQNSEGRAYGLIHLTKPMNYAVYTPFMYSNADLMPWGLVNKTADYPFGYQFNVQYTLKYGFDANVSGDTEARCGALVMGSTGASQYRSNIANGVSNFKQNTDGTTGVLYYVGEVLQTEPNNMLNPTKQGLQDRLAAGKFYLELPVVTTLDTNSTVETTIVGFINFMLSGVDTAHGYVYGQFVDTIPRDQLTYTLNIDENDVIPAKMLKMAGIPYSWIHDTDVLNGNISNYQWIACSHTDFFNENVPEKIAEWVAGGHYFFNLCWSTLRFDNALTQYNHNTYGNNSQSYVPSAFFQSYSTIQTSKCPFCKNHPGSSCDACRNTGWVQEYVKYTDVDNDALSNYTLSPRDIPLNQDHVTVVPADLTAGRVQSFKTSGLLSSCQVFASNNSPAYRQVITAYPSSSVAKVVSRTYKIHDSDPGGVMTFMGGHDPGNAAGYRMMLNSCLACAESPLISAAIRTDFGALDMDSVLETSDPEEYLGNVKYGYKYLLTPGQIVDTLPGNQPDKTNTGVFFNVGSDHHTWNNYPIDSQRVVLVPIVSTRTPDSLLTCISQPNIDSPPRSIYSINQRDKVRIKGIAKFWLLDVNQWSYYDMYLGPLTNGQVRGIFLGYFIPPVDGK